MLTPVEALDLVLKTSGRGAPRSLPLAECSGLVCAADIAAGRGYPFFSFSAVDGYAVRMEDLATASRERPVSLKMQGEVRAARSEPLRLEPGRTLRIMTGGALPEGAGAVVMREDTREEQTHTVFFAPAEPESHINRAGAEISPGDILLPAGTRLTPPALGLLATLGVAGATVYPPPVVALLATGDELAAPGADLGHGQVYDSVTPMLGAALRAAGVAQVLEYRSPDQPESLFSAFSQALGRADIVLTVGGVSLGDHDLMGSIFSRAEVRKVFWKVAQKPGKPLFFGRSGAKLVFGLPGNPAAAMVCFSLYVLTAVRSFMGRPEDSPRWLEGRLSGNLENRDSRVSYLRGDFGFGGDGVYEVRAGGGQQSYMLGSFARSRALVELPAGPVRLEAGARVRFLPHFWECQA